jgi:hypothetical protein
MRIANACCLVLCSLAVLSHALNSYFVYFQIEPAGLRCKNLWRTRHFAWFELTRVGNYCNTSAPSEKFLEVDYLRMDPSPEIGMLLIRAKDRKGLIEALRNLAPQAEFDV